MDNRLDIDEDSEPIPCKKCRGLSKRSMIWDKHFCPSCNEWLEKRCTKESCPDCPFEGWNMPEKPLGEFETLKAIEKIEKGEDLIKAKDAQDLFRKLGI